MCARVSNDLISINQVQQNNLKIFEAEFEIFRYWIKYLFDDLLFLKKNPNKSLQINLWENKIVLFCIEFFFFFFFLRDFG